MNDDKYDLRKKPEEGFEVQNESKGVFLLAVIVVLLLLLGFLWGFRG